MIMRFYIEYMPITIYIVLHIHFKKLYMKNFKMINRENFIKLHRKHFKKLTF